MKAKLLIAMVCMIIAGCAGLEITPLTYEQSSKLHIDQDTAFKNGYVVYEPMLVVEISDKEICVLKDGDKCKKSRNVCSAGEIKTLPDYSKPYLLTSKSGLGKAGVDLKIDDGWRLGGIKDESDNTALLGVLATAAGIQTKALINDGTQETSRCPITGLHKLTYDSATQKHSLGELILSY
jgi:hypothetical protein